MDADERETDNKVDPIRIEEEESRLEVLDAAREFFLNNARLAADKVPEGFVSLWSAGMSKNNQSRAEVIERFIEVCADVWSDLIAHDEVEKSKEIVETGVDA